MSVCTVAGRRIQPPRLLHAYFHSFIFVPVPLSAIRCEAFLLLPIISAPPQTFCIENQLCQSYLLLQLVANCSKFVLAHLLIDFSPIYLIKRD